MYYNGQVVHNYDTGQPCQVGDGGATWAWDNVPENTAPYIIMHGYFGYDYVFKLMMPKTIEEAQELLANHMIVPAPKYESGLKNYMVDVSLAKSGLTHVRNALEAIIALDNTRPVAVPNSIGCG
jgi:hypothetical protein